jgi:NAD(P)-dependent dehydrogenase (short-subunit alcohol dehydrogenase family)
MTCLIYGGTGGIGSALARVLVAKGRKVHLDSRDAAKLAIIPTILAALLDHRVANTGRSPTS